MSILRKCLWCMVISFVLFSIVGLAQAPAKVAASPAYVNPFTDEVDSLSIMKMWPEKDWNPAKNLDYKLYFSLAEKLFNGRKPEPLFTRSTKTPPPGNINYKDALTIVGGLMGFPSEEALIKMKELTPELKRADNALISGYDVAYIFSVLLKAKRVGQTMSLIEERYLVGLNPLKISRALQINASRMVTEDEGTVALAPNVQVFTLEGTGISPVGLSDVAAGRTGLKIYWNDKKQVQTILLNGRYSPKNIRVLLSQELSPTGSSKSYDFPQIQVTATQPFKIVAREKGEDKIILVAETDEVITFTNNEGGIRIATGNFVKTVKNRVYLKSYLWHDISFDPLITTSHKEKVSVYAGTLEIFPSNKQGSLYLVNELPIEMYLHKVVAAQTPASWGKEVAKVQAIAARSYAIAQMTQSKFNDKGANVDDSSATQIYNNAPESIEINEAVDETEGMVVTSNGHVVDAVFFSSSAGFTANSEEVWHNDRTKEFPGVPIPYLRSRSLIYEGIVPIINSEISALAFFKNNSYKSFDAAAPFFRWRVEFTGDELARAISRGLVERKKNDVAAGTKFTYTLEGQQIDIADPNFSIGKLMDLRVVLRGESGNIMALDVQGTKGTYRVKKEFNIRSILKPRKDYTGSSEDVVLYLNDGSLQKNYALLPSSFAAFEISRDPYGFIEHVTIYGGGNGHGVGLSQWAVKGLVESGHTPEQIFELFYRGIKLEKIY